MTPFYISAEKCISYQTKFGYVVGVISVAQYLDRKKDAIPAPQGAIPVLQGAIPGLQGSIPGLHGVRTLRGSHPSTAFVRTTVGVLAHNTPKTPLSDSKLF